MSVTDVLPLLVVVLLLIGASGADPDAMHVVFEGARDADAVVAGGATDPIVVAGGTVTVPANATVGSPVYVIGGTAVVEGTVDAEVTVLAGNLSVLDDAAITGDLRSFGGTTTVAARASVPRRTTVDVAPRERTLAERLGFLAMQALALAALAFLLARRAPDALATVGDAMTGHALVSGVVGALAGVTLLVGFVAMAFTVVLVPVSVLGVVGELLVLLYALAAAGARLGRALPIDRPDVAAAAGAALLVVALDLLDAIPVVGALATLTVVSVGFGAVLVTYFGWQAFEPADIPG
ncbi:polymer-forming cytoskeletal protein [Halorubellus salinus]|uniref:polymer-forming cytoskeletal protein n=1 Tax=Halorubellus salinus TaxID=755309 RepID=UPI001D0726DB|nr:polymer-forming cytoskeletal protein [Halorubellus salinus]